MTEPAATADLPTNTSWLRPSWGRLAVATVIAGAGFLLPQEVPLEWYPLNEPGTDINYLEISCASDKDGHVQIFYNLSTGITPLNSIYFPISPTEQTFTYTFPLPDGPITELRLDPVAQGGTLTIRQMRIINRRNEEIRRFTQDMFRPQHEIASIEPLPDGWKIASTTNAIDPYARIELFSPIVPVGKDLRNILRCLLSTGYLAGMLFILLMAVLTATWRPRGWRDFLVHASFMAGLALLFAPVGNRGLIRNSFHYSRYVPPAITPGLRLEFDLTTSGPSPTQLFWDIGRGINADDTFRDDYLPHTGLQTVRFPLPAARLQALRYDPRDNPGQVRIRGIRVVDNGQRTRAVIPLDSLRPERQVARLEIADNFLHVESTPDATDPILSFSPAALALINQAIAREPGR